MSAEMQANIAKLEALSQRLTQVLAKKRPTNPQLLGPDPQLYQKAASAFMADFVADPAKMFEKQAAFWGESLKHWSQAQSALMGITTKERDENSSKDRRFRNPLWDSHPFFQNVKEQYLLTARAIEESTGDLSALSDDEKRRVQFFTQQVVDMFSPLNFLPTNPDALQKALETEGKSLVEGLENFVRDLEANDGELLVTLSDPDSFEVGENIATTPGSVVYQNRMFQLIQYAPTTEKVRKIPLILFPPWINKFYILDLKPENSFIKYAVDAGFTVFVVSWVNPDGTYRDVGIDTYMQEGVFEAVRVVKEITGQPKVNAIGYCIAGTLLTLSLAHMAKIGDDSIQSATYFTTLTDFEDPGELSVFIDDAFLKGIEGEVEEKGFFEAFYMARTFSYLRARDLVYGPAIRSYMLGEKPPAFDLLYWNSDSTNLPARMAREYLYGLYRSNDFSEGRFEVLGETLDMADVDLPIYVIATKSDHIAPWQSSFKGLNKTSGKKNFVLAQSGHIAGIVNPPAAKKYGHWLNEADPGSTVQTLDQWAQDAEFHEGSWWDKWNKWFTKRAGTLVKARLPGSETYPVLEAAPGSYVKQRAPQA